MERSLALENDNHWTYRLISNWYNNHRNSCNYSQQLIYLCEGKSSYCWTSGVYFVAPIDVWRFPQIQMQSPELPQSPVTSFGRTLPNYGFFYIQYTLLSFVQNVIFCGIVYTKSFITQTHAHILLIHYKVSGFTEKSKTHTHIVVIKHPLRFTPG